jgi:hypothetical protein
MVTGYLWIAMNYFFGWTITPCVFKNLTGWPCPGCGSTRAAMAFFDLRIADAIRLNPMGIMFALGAVVLPFWLLADFIRKKNTLYEFWNRANLIINKKPVLIFLFAFIALIWIHNFMIGL